MQETLARLTTILFGDPRRCSLEQRLFNTITLLSAATNLGGAVRYLDVPRQLFLFLLHVGSGPGRTDKFHYRFGELLDQLAAKGYQFVRVDELLQAPVKKSK